MLVDAEPIRRSDLHPMLAELAGSRVIDEIVLARALDRIAADRSIAITPERLAFEREDLLASLDPAADGARGADTIGVLRARRGLGPRRFALLLRSNAILRALVESDPAHEIELEQRVRESLALAGSPTVRARIARFEDARDARAARDLIAESSRDARPWVFAEIASSRAIGPERALGGLAPALRLEDPTIPSAVRTRLETLGVGEVSGVLSTDEGFVLVLVESPRDETVLTEARAREIERRARRVATRERMERLAGSILGAADVLVMDRSLGWSREAGTP